MPGRYCSATHLATSKVPTFAISASVVNYKSAAHPQVHWAGRGAAAGGEHTTSLSRQRQSNHLSAAPFFRVVATSCPMPILFRLDVLAARVAGPPWPPCRKPANRRGALRRCGEPRLTPSRGGKNGRNKTLSCILVQSALCMSFPNSGFFFFLWLGRGSCLAV